MPEEPPSGGHSWSQPGAIPAHTRPWQFRRGERIALAVALCFLIAFGALIEKRTALRRVPMTDLGVFSCAAWGVLKGQSIYYIQDWHGWHYQYPPTLAILFTPLAHPVPPPTPLIAGGPRGLTNAPWGYKLEGQTNFYGLDRQNARFFAIVLIWYVISVALVCISAHTMACVLERRHFAEPPPIEASLRRNWWLLRCLPVLACAGSILTEFSRGQVDVVMLAAVSLGLYWAAIGSETRGGIWLSFPATIKLFPPLLLLYPVLRRRWHMAAGVLIGLVLALIVLPAIILGPRRTLNEYRIWWEVLAKPALGYGTDTSRAQELTGISATDNQSLLSFVHSWKYMNVPREKRTEPSAGERNLVYGVGAVMFLGTAFFIAAGRRETSTYMVLGSGLLIALAFVISPIVHNYYYLMLMPLIAALLHREFNDSARAAPRSRMVLASIALFGVLDLIVRLPRIGDVLQDRGFPLLSLLLLIGVGTWVLRRDANRQETLELA